MRGVLPPEACFEPMPFFEEMAQYGKEEDRDEPLLGESLEGPPNRSDPRPRPSPSEAGFGGDEGSEPPPVCRHVVAPSRGIRLALATVILCSNGNS